MDVMGISDKKNQPLNRGRIKTLSPLFHRHRVRSWVQTGVFIATLATGVQFALYVHQAAQAVPITIPKPHGVEGFLPIGALLGWKYFITTAQWDSIHPAAMVIFGFALVASFLLSKSFCGWFCPVGTLSEWIFRLGHHWGMPSFIFPRWVDLPLRSVKYIFLGFFLWIIVQMNTVETNAFLNSFYYKTSDVRMLLFFTHMSGTTLICLSLLVCFSLFVQNFWCRYLCPYGALAGIVSYAGPTHISRDNGSCIACGKCTAICPNHILVGQTPKVRTPECTGCMDCVDSCPVDGTLMLKTTGLKMRWTEKKLGLMVIALYLILVYTAIITGHWKSSVPDQQYRMFIAHMGINR